MRPYSFWGHWFYRDEDHCPSTKHTGSNKRKRKAIRRTYKKIRRAKDKARLRRGEE